ncbi:DUF7282 domain-containing protein [Natronoarchaeum rubrum]|uniref:DUF7282 domain-containing protein n=1 Tax=Natronoarchaeum rubrum TaxID=755311 RepID=UPI002113341A|nr:hypothetical protein [Natronoarchaeum rubrum]
MKQPNRRTISVLFVAIALVLAIGPALGAAGATAPSVQEGDDATDDGITDESEDTGAQNGTDDTDETDDQSEDDSESQTRTTIDRITIDRISTDYVTMENVTIEGINITTSAAEMLFGQMPDDGIDVDDGLDNETDDGIDNETDDGLDNETDDGLDNETDDGLDNETDDGLDNETDDEQLTEPNASVTFEDQETNGSTVTVDSVNVSEGGFVTIHNSSLLEGATFDSVIGSSEYLDPGEHEDVEVQLFDNETVPGAEFDQDALEDNETLIAMPHLDTNDNETYDFIETEGAEDGPYTEDGEAVIDDAEITVVDGEMENVTDDNMTDGDEMDNVSDGDEMDNVSDDNMTDGDEMENVTDDNMTDGDEMDNETEMAGDAPVPEGDSYGVSSLEAPETATVGETLNVSAEISNPNDFESNQSVEFRLDGDVVDRQFIVLEGGENETVTFEIPSDGLEAGDYNHGILTFDEGEVADITLEAEEEDDEEEAPVDDGEDEEDAEPNATVTFDDQETDGSTVTVQSVNVSEGGFVTIHDSSLLEGATFDSVVGSSEYLDPGEHEDVEVQLFDNETVPGAEFDQDALEENQTLIAMPHLDTNDNESYDFIETEGAEDGPYTEDGEAVIDDAEITVVEDDVDEATDDAEPSATLDVADQSGDGTTLEVAEASADEDFYVVANYDGETSESPTFNAVEERLDYSLTLDPPIEDDTTVEVAILAAEDDEELTSQEIEYTVEADGDADVEDGADDGDANATDGTTNETDGDATGVDGNETAALLA